MIRVVWLTQYNVYELLPEVELNREVILHSSSWIHNLSDQLAQENEIELHIITYSQLVDKSQYIKKKNIYFHIVKYNFPFTKKGFPWFLPLDKLTSYYTFSKNAHKIINQVRPNVLHVHGTEGGYFVPALKTNIPCIISIQGIISEIQKIQPTITGYSQLRYEHTAIKNGKYFGCRTNFDFEYVKKNNKEATIFNLPEAINKIFFEQKWNPQPGLSILFVGTVIKRKGIEDLIQAICKLKACHSEIKLKIIGVGTEKYTSYLKKKIETLDLTSNISFLGQKNANDVALELSKSNLFVLPSLIDNSPNSLAEAMAIGVPSIATKVGGIPSMINDGHDGILFEKNDVNGLVDLIKHLKDNITLQNMLSENARKRAFERNHPTNVVHNYIHAYKIMIDE